MSLINLFKKDVSCFDIEDLSTPTVRPILASHFNFSVLPVLLIVIILKIIPHIIHAIAKSVIRFKTRSQVDSFVMFWNTAYRLANIYVSIFAVSADQAFALFLECPEVFFRYLASTILGQAPYFMNLMLIATGMETMILLSQPRSLIKHLISRPFVNLNAKSRRYHEKLNTAHKMEEAFMFGGYQQCFRVNFAFFA
jgi:hypothetical protein